MIARSSKSGEMGESKTESVIEGGPEGVEKI
jgi:hypothetical protein